MTSFIRTLLICFAGGFSWISATTTAAPAATSQVPQVVSLSPAITEIIYALHLQDHLVGVSAFSDYPKEASQKTSVGPYTKPNMEKILDLHPDLVIVPAEGPEEVKDRLDQIHVHYQVVTMKKIDDVGQTAQQIGVWLGNASAGENFKKNWDREVKGTPYRFRKGMRGNGTAYLFVEVQNEPLMAAGRGTFLDEMVSRCGGVNVVTKPGYPIVSKEKLLSMKIDLVLLTDYFAHESEKTAALESWQKWPTTKNAKVVVLNPDLASRPGPRLLQGMKMICGAINDPVKNP